MNGIYTVGIVWVVFGTCMGVVNRPRCDTDKDRYFWSGWWGGAVFGVGAMLLLAAYNGVR